MKYRNHALPILLLLTAAALVTAPACKKATAPAPLAPVAAAPKKATPAEPAPEAAEEKAETFSYKVTDRNPFGSLLRVKKNVEEVPEVELTPLQRVALSDMRLESIIISSKRSVAHLVTPDGKAHIITVGTLLGRHNGRVVRINKDELVVEEQFEDYLGRAFKQETILRLREEGENL
ncbi:MAG: pilus assembly protein PilP [Pseudomonadota bacterium]|jgi:Tfp pilus assembly protein PilP